MRHALLCALVLPLLAACSRPGGSSPSGTPPDAAAAPATASRVHGRAPAGTLVVLAPAEAAPLPDGPAVLDQYSKAFVPDLLFVRVGQPVIFKNSEDQLHNVAVVRLPTGSSIFNISQNQGDVHTHTFEQAGEYDVTCDVHPGMRATIVASDSPYAVYADGRGAFEFQNIPPGPYQLRASRGGRVSERRIEVAGAEVDVGDVRAGS